MFFMSKEKLTYCKMMPRPVFLYRNAVVVILVTTVAIDQVLTTTYSRSLTEILNNYDTLKKEEISHRIVRRSAGIVARYEREMHFKSLGREFHLRVIPDHSIFSPDFKAILVREDEEIEVNLDKDSFMTGFVEGVSGSKVQAHLEDGILTANIELHDDSYIVESSTRHVDGLHDFHMVVYKLSDVKSNLSNPNSHHGRKHAPFCGVKDHDKNKVDSQNQVSDSDLRKTEVHSRKRRSAQSSAIETYDTCQLALVADHLFYEHMGQGKSSTAINYMLSVIQRVDQIYRAVNWPSGLKNIGFEVRKVILHDKPSGSSGPEYNQHKSGAWDEEELLSAFSRGPWIDRNICLGHLFTYQDFPNGVIGVAYVANDQIGTNGGICSNAYKDSKARLTQSGSGLSSSKNWGRRLLTSEADVVTAHELGHNFGSNHDSSTKECAPSESDGGKYMMYSTSVSGLKPNNKKFSPCSVRTIDKVLVSKRTSCFRSKVGQYCGNNEVERNLKDPSKSEECDPGLDAKLNDTDRCCTVNCKLRSGARCSDSNMPCCENCQPASKTKKCRESFTLACQGETYCDGVNADCPEAPKLSGVPCAISKGKCFNGVCRSLCEQNGKVSCLCSSSEGICKICCRTPNTTGACNPIIVNGTSLNVNDGGPCDTGSYTGSCVQGTCKKTQKNVFDHFLNLLQDFTASKFAQFMEENIVGTILVFSLLIWVPASCIVHYVDKRRDREETERIEWEDINNADLLRKQKEDRKKGVFKPTPKKSPRGHVSPRGLVSPRR